MSGSYDEDDKSTVILDLDALKRDKLKQEEELSNLASELEFNVIGKVAARPTPQKTSPPPQQEPSLENKFGNGEETDQFVDEFLSDRRLETAHLKIEIPIILFDFQSELFAEATDLLPDGFDYKKITKLSELNQCLKTKSHQIVVLNYDANPKAINQLSAQINQKFPFTKTLIVARSISAEKALIHAQGQAGANGYYQLPFETQRLEEEIMKIYELDM